MILDFETASTLDLSEVGANNYCSHSSTFVLCCAMQLDDGAKAVWIHPRVMEYADSAITLPEDILRIQSDTHELYKIWLSQKEFIAHNAAFERRVIAHKFAQMNHLFTDLNLWSCTMARAAAENLPLALGKIAFALNLPVKKADTASMKKASRLDNYGSFTVKPEVLNQVISYCLQDVEVIALLNQRLPQLSEKEKMIWMLDQIINDRGCTADTALAVELQTLLKNAELRLLTEFQRLTQGAVNSPRQIEAFSKWLKMRGVAVSSCDKESMKTILKSCVDVTIRRAIEIRQSLSTSSTAKIDALLSTVSPDGRIRGMFQYHGAGTGRWSGRGIQPQNLPRAKLSDYDERAIYVTKHDLDDFELMYGPSFGEAKKMLRGLLIAKPGYLLSSGDLASIEARVIAWLADEQKVLQTFRDGLDLYKVAVADIFKTSYDKITEIQRQIGKVAVLALGYQGGVKAFNSMGQNYGITVPEEEADKIVVAWRASRPRTTALWRALNNAAIESVSAGGHAKPKTVGRLAFAMRKNRLLMRLPSGRFLVYHSPKVLEGEYGPKVEFSGTSSQGAWIRHDLYGGLLAENATQAVARDILAEAMLRMHHAGMAIVLHVHDEVVIEHLQEEERLSEVLKLLTQQPVWAEGLPIAAEGWTGRRYRK